MERNTNKKDEIIRCLLKREVLRHLQEQGAISYNLLHVHFARNRKADIHAVLQDLQQCKYLEVDKDDMITITTAGIRLLKDADYWT